MTRILRLALAATCIALPNLADGAASLSTLHGTWVSPAPEPWYGGWGTREFVFSDGHWSLDFVHALDPEMTQRTLRFRTGGAYTVTAPSEAVPGAYEAVFGEDWKHVTVLTDDPGILQATGLAACDLPFNLEADISAEGCAAWKPVAVCGEDHDLLALSEEGLHFGVRPADNDMCTADRRPTELLPAVVPY
ncbi:hypothetical protein [Pontivivens ytuae]|uniref:APCDD1 domain-containing protein n=1 Tax=Pontivivens ytuae TaxID=2789856 RepID=A0A7S9LQG8_9RHOB|nr:hypothetical protein [Pontivivens ytuae]QPH53246.1 hypothetical protein I0K15_15845 [Pontivivens ytuae]